MKPSQPYTFHMSVYQILYLTVLAASFGICLFAYPSFEHTNRSLKVLLVLLSISLFTELVVNILHYTYNRKYAFIYHIYIPVEYTLLAYFFYLNNKTFVRRLILVSIPLYIIFSTLISLNLLTVEDHPSLNFNLAGVLLIIWCFTTFFSISATQNVAFTHLPIFWICLGILIFHSGIFFFNGIYNHLLDINPKLALDLHRMIIKSANYILYTCFSIGFLCSYQMKKKQ